MYRQKKDLLQICATGAENCVLKSIERRTPKGRTQRESGYSSAGYLSQVYNSTPDQSSNRLSTADSSTVSTEEADLFNPSISGLDSSASKECLPKHGVTFYSQSPPPSTTSLTNVNELDPLTHSCNSNSEQESNTSPSDIQTEPNELNDLSKPSSEEDNTKLADDSCSSTK
ncbi:uncharacterized protein LOC123542114 [Mercenaria mercenaria]|uniref:uncharacterized protein LOC123542114 n=1 Tax=Mercenaria mercenaria TaxID=6596 RepID=UPI00234EF505|nr:uncharacterized protein LOC123542114 [Mercenaria mercenaria]